MTPTLFRHVYRQFANPDTAPDDAINYWITLAGNYLNGSQTSFGQRFDPVSLDYGIGLFVAHHLTLDQRDIATAAAGGVPGEIKGPPTAKAVDKVSASYDSKAVTFADEAFWNQTRYGVQLMDLVRRFGAGAIQLGLDGTGGLLDPFPGFGIDPPG